MHFLICLCPHHFHHLHHRHLHHHHHHNYHNHHHYHHHPHHHPIYQHDNYQQNNQNQCESEINVDAAQFISSVERVYVCVCVVQCVVWWENWEIDHLDNWQCCLCEGAFFGVGELIWGGGDGGVGF